MSRAAAVAYHLPDSVEERNSRLNTEQYRLLGIEQAGNRATSRYGALRPLPTVRETGFYPSEREDASFAGYYATDLKSTKLRARIRLSRPFLSAMVVMVLLAVTVLGMMSAVPARGNTLMLSGYRDLSTQPATASNAEVAAPPPVIDATTGTTPAATEPQLAPKQPGAYSVLGPPSLSVQQIEIVLRQYGSPAAGLGQKLYDLGVKYGIDPAYALAFFVHESGCGTKGVARFSKSVGNIRWTEGYGNYEGYRSYPNWESGMEDWYKLITDLYIGGWGLRTVDAIIPVYAPWGDNNHPPTYIASVKAMVDSWRGK